MAVCVCVDMVAIVVPTVDGSPLVIGMAVKPVEGLLIGNFVLVAGATASTVESE